MTFLWQACVFKEAWVTLQLILIYSPSGGECCWLDINTAADKCFSLDRTSTNKWVSVVILQYSLTSFIFIDAINKPINRLTDWWNCGPVGWSSCNDNQTVSWHVCTLYHRWRKYWDCIQKQQRPPAAQQHAAGVRTPVKRRWPDREFFKIRCLVSYFTPLRTLNACCVCIVSIRVHRLETLQTDYYFW